MKKTYLKPTTEIEFIETEKMIAASNPEDGFNLSGLEGTEETSGNLGREDDDLWED